MLKINVKVCSILNDVFFLINLFIISDSLNFILETNAKLCSLLFRQMQWRDKCNSEQICSTSNYQNTWLYLKILC